MLKKMICKRTNVLSLIAVTIVAVIPASQTAAEEVFYDKAQVLSSRPLYETKTVPMTSEQCDDTESDAKLLSESSSAKGLVEAIRENPRQDHVKDPQPR